MQSEPITDHLKELMEIPGVSWIVYIALLVCLVLTAVYVAGLFRNMAIGNFSSSPEEDLDLIREIRDRDMIADEEFDKAKDRIRQNNESGLSAMQVPEEKKTDFPGNAQ